MWQGLFNIILTMLTSIIQIIVLPINAVIIAVLPDISDKIASLSNSLTTFFSGIAWGLGLLPNSLVATLLFILGVEIARHSIFISTHIISLIFDIIHRIKFW